MSDEIRNSVKKAEKKAKPQSRAEYTVDNGNMVWSKPTKNGPVPVYLSNFAARIVSDVQRDDGAETTREYELFVTLHNEVLRFPISAAEFGSLRWVDDQLGAGAMIEPGQAMRMLAAIKAMSDDFIKRKVYAHTGWRRIGDDYVYLHGAGAIGTIGTVENIKTDLDSIGLSRYVLPDPIDDQDAVRASLAIIDITVKPVTMLLLGTVYRAPLGAVGHTSYLVGQTGSFKTALSALAAQHFGADMHANALPASWMDTANSIEALSFHCKDGLLVVDDFAPQATVDTAKLHQSAARFIRAQGNLMGRKRMRADTSLRPSKPPRGSTLSSGEDIPLGHSVRARLVIAEIKKDDVDVDRLTEAQRQAADGVFAQAMAGYIKWLAPRIAEIQKNSNQEIADLRNRFHSAHARTPDAFAEIMRGWQYFLQYAVEIGAVSEAEAQGILKQAFSAMGELLEIQEAHQQAADPVTKFFRFLSSAISAGNAHIAGMEQVIPLEPESWGWRSRGHGMSSSWESRGSQIGWLDGDDLWLDPDAALKAANDMASPTGKITTSANTLVKRMGDEGKLVTVGKDRNRTRKTIRGQRKENLIHVSASLLREKTCQSYQSSQIAEKTAVFQEDQGEDNWDDPENNRTSTVPIAEKNVPEESAIGTVSDPLVHGWDGSESKTYQKPDAKNLENPGKNNGGNAIGTIGTVIRTGERLDKAEIEDDPFAIPAIMDRRPPLICARCNGVLNQDERGLTWLRDNDEVCHKGACPDPERAAIDMEGLISAST